MGEQVEFDFNACKTADGFEDVVDLVGSVGGYEG